MNVKKNLNNHPRSSETHGIQGRDHQKLVPLQNGKKNYVPGEIIIKFKDGTDEQAIEIIQREFSLKTIRIIHRPNLYLMKILNGFSVEETVKRLKDFPEIEYSEPNYIRTIY